MSWGWDFFICFYRKEIKIDFMSEFDTPDRNSKSYLEENVYGSNINSGINCEKYV